MNTVPEAYTNLIKENIETALKDPAVNKIAAFDADGTCWLSDVGRDFFDYQIKENYFSGPPLTWEDYQKEEDKSMERGLFWLAEILAGLQLDELRKFVDGFNKSVRPTFIEHQKEIIKFLIEKGVRVHIVTASVKWTVEAGALDLGIPYENVIGIETEVENGIITPKQKGPLSWQSGKVDALLARTNGLKPFFVSGNTMSDYPMMQLSTHLRQVIHSATPEDSIYKSEHEALTLAKQHGWHYFNFISGEHL